MALKKKEKERLEKLDFSKGGGFSDFITDRRKMTPDESKFLFVGLGGKGGKTVAAIKTEVYKKITCNDEIKRPDNFEYLVVDTDKKEIDRLIRGEFGEVGLSGSPADSDICQLYDGTAAERLSPSKRHEIHENIVEWLNPTMNQELQGEGAGGVRQAGRYLLFGEEAFRRLENSLKYKLQKLHNQITDSAKQDLIVYIFAGVGGGTGSGIIIDVPYIIREICKRNNWRVKLYSYIFLPDTYPQEATGAHLKYNSYAALKEIDTLMNIGMMNGAAHFRAQYTSEFSVDSVERIFDSCVLVSGKRSSGLVPDPEKFSKRVVVDNIINLVSKNETNDGFLVNSFLDNKLTEVQNAVGRLSNDTVPKNAYYQYTVIGTGALILPIEQIFAYIARGTMNMLKKAWDKQAEQKHVEELLTKIQMKPQEFSAAIVAKSKVPLMQYSKGIGGKVTKAEVVDGSLFSIVKQYWLRQNVGLYDAWDEAKNIYLEYVISQLKEYYYSIFKDGEKGIYYLKELLSSKVIEGNGFNGLYRRISDEYMSSISGLIGGQQTLQAQIEQEMQDIKTELNSPLCLFPNKKIEEYRELCVSRLVSENMIYMYDDIVRDCLKQVLGFIQSKMEEIQKYIDVFVYMQDIINRNYQNVMEGTMPQTEYAGQLIDFSQRSDEATLKIIKYLDEMLGVKRPEGLAVALEERIINTEKQWIHSEEEFDPMSVFVKFLETQYSELPNLTIEKFIRLKYGENGFDIGMQGICQELKNKSEIIFPADTIISMNSLASKRYVVIPAGALDITKNMSAFAKANGATVAYSNDMNSMYWYNLVIGVPMFLLKDIKEYELIYEKNEISGMHCWENSGANWKEWPNLYNQKQWENAEFNKREREYASKVERDVEKYKNSGLIQRDKDTGLFHAYCILMNNVEKEEKNILGQYQKFCMEKVNGVDSADKPFVDIDFVDVMIKIKKCSQYIINIPSVYMKVTEENVYKLVRMNVNLYHMLQATYKIYLKCRTIQDTINETLSCEFTKQKNMQRFYDYIRTGIIQITEDAVLLENENGEQDEIMYFDDYNVWDNKFYVYVAFQNFSNNFSEEHLMELDEYRQELIKDRSEEAKLKYRKLSDDFIQHCTSVQESLKKFDTKKALEKAGRIGKLESYKEFYDMLLSMKRGR